MKRHLETRAKPCGVAMADPGSYRGTGMMDTSISGNLDGCTHRLGIKV